jgi:histidine triad (HIT) family protein
LSECLFCQIVDGSISADIVARNERAIAFRDIDPKAPTHVLVIPTEHHRDLTELTAADSSQVADVLALAVEVAELEKLGSGYRVVFNTGADGGQTVFHVHAHVMGGRRLTWPPG